MVALISTTIFSQWSTSSSYRNENPRNLFDSQNQLSGFLVNTEACRIPDLDPFDYSIKEYIQEHTKTKCSAQPAVTYQDGDILRINFRTISKVLGGYFSHCDYVGIQRQSEQNDDRFIFTKNVKFTNDTKITEEFIRVDCFQKSGDIFYTNFHAFIIPQQTAISKLTIKFKNRLKAKHVTESLNVLMVGVDSVSRLNHIRTMPKTRKYLLERLSAVELGGYTKVADNTFVNIVPMTTGKFLEELPWDETLSSKSFDKFNFIWKVYGTNGYSTLYAEDAPDIAIFNYLKSGFHKPPADHYNRPFALAMEAESSVWVSKHNCVGNRLETNIVLKYLGDFVKVYQKRPHFAFTFISRLTHNLISDAEAADDPYFSWIQAMHKDGLLNNTVLIFFSDHGMRFGNFRNTYIGKLEERLPMMYLVFPEWFHEKYRNISQNLKVNANRLTTPFDIYETLKDILHFNGLVKGKVNLKQRGISLFEEIPKYRSCDDAGILPHWCVCMAETQLPKDDKLSQQGVNYLISEINRQLSPVNHTCSTLTLAKVKYVHLLKNNDKVMRFSGSHNDVINRVVTYTDAAKAISVLQISVSLTPGSGEFEATLKYYESSNIFKMAGDISRINKYGRDGNCIDNARLRKYCFCLK